MQDLRRYFRKSETTGVIRRRKNGRIKRVKGVIMDTVVREWIELLTDIANSDVSRGEHFGKAKAELFAKRVEQTLALEYGEKFNREAFKSACQVAFDDEAELEAERECRDMMDSGEYDMSGWEPSYDSVSYNDGGEPIGYM